MKKRILSGITPSGSQLHIGNYFGAIKPQIELQNDDEYETYYFIADLHALTTVKDRDQLEENIVGVVLDYLSLGLDSEKCVFFRQSDVPAQSQLAVVLANYASFANQLDAKNTGLEVKVIEALKKKADIEDNKSKFY